MNLREWILEEHSRRQSLKIAGWIGKDRKRFAQLINIFLHDEYRVVQRSAWIISYVAEKNPELIKDNIHALVGRLFDEDIHVAVKRNVVRVLQFIPVPKNLHAKVINLCFGYLADPNESIAVRCFSMTVLANFVMQYPEIKSEFEAVLSSRFKDTKGGLKARAKQVLKEINGAELRN